jgi:aspartate kinase
MADIHISSNKNIVKLTLHSIPNVPGMAAEIFGVLGVQGVNVELVISNAGSHGSGDLSLAISEGDVEKALKVLEQIKDKVKAEKITTDTEVGLVSIGGSELARTAGTAGKIFVALSKAGINIQAISTSLASVTCLIAKKNLSHAIESLEKEFQV